MPAPTEARLKGCGNARGSRKTGPSGAEDTRTSKLGHGPWNLFPGWRLALTRIGFFNAGGGTDRSTPQVTCRASELSGLGGFEEPWNFADRCIADLGFVCRA